MGLIKQIAKNAGSIGHARKRGKSLKKREKTKRLLGNFNGRRVRVTISKGAKKAKAELRRDMDAIAIVALIVIVVTAVGVVAVVLDMTGVI